MSENKCIVLIGIKHSGKTTQGKLLAQKLGCDFVDLDDVITEITGSTPRDIYQEKGPAGFMIAEEEAARSTIRKFKDKAVVIATGGGICDNQPALNVLYPTGNFIFLDVSEKTSFERIMKKVTQGSDGKWHNLPAYLNLKNPKTREDIKKIYHDFYEERTARYKIIGDKSVRLLNQTKEQNLEALLKVIN